MAALKLLVTRAYEVPDGEYREKFALNVQREVFDYINKGLLSVTVDFVKEEK